MDSSGTRRCSASRSASESRTPAVVWYSTRERVHIPSSPGRTRRGRALFLPPRAVFDGRGGNLRAQAVERESGQRIFVAGELLGDVRQDSMLPDQADPVLVQVRAQ